ncbi:hypothetical protein [Pseudoalteromonas maricaloris]|uniref:Uncharacterized protein n=1 Tax=Pseudoalteromonas maricaloris TaxID=184924 RepID=A0A8I2KS68_9GAMM|nr:hypothetical protein [Pseudoalteromonas maricaloris]NLR23362.1 hypothetical protein [Pseudoalteromonas maricaloris]WOX29257.1 hypothetical protein R5H13_03000 [Pseudoalteromonas maricaloris]
MKCFSICFLSKFMRPISDILESLTVNSAWMFMQFYFGDSIVDRRGISKVGISKLSKVSSISSRDLTEAIWQLHEFGLIELVQNVCEIKRGVTEKRVKIIPKIKIKIYAELTDESKAELKRLLCIENSSLPKTTPKRVRVFLAYCMLKPYSMAMGFDFIKAKFGIGKLGIIELDKTTWLGRGLEEIKVSHVNEVCVVYKLACSRAVFSKGHIFMFEHEISAIKGSPYEGKNTHIDLKELERSLMRNASTFSEFVSSLWCVTRYLVFERNQEYLISESVNVDHVQREHYKLSVNFIDTIRQKISGLTSDDDRLKSELEKSALELKELNLSSLKHSLPLMINYLNASKNSTKSEKTNRLLAQRLVNKLFKRENKILGHYCLRIFADYFLEQLSAYKRASCEAVNKIDYEQVHISNDAVLEFDWAMFGLHQYDNEWMFFRAKSEPSTKQKS